VPEDAIRCKHCGTDLRSWFKRHPLLTFLLIIFALGYLVSHLPTRKKTSITTQESSVDKSAVSKDYNVNDSMVSSQRGITKSGHIVCATWDAFTDAIDYGLDENVAGFARLLKDGTCGELEAGLEVEVLEYTLFLSGRVIRIRTKTGEGWTDVDAVRIKQ